MTLGRGIKAKCEREPGFKREPRVPDISWRAQCEEAGVVYASGERPHHQDRDPDQNHDQNQNQHQDQNQHKRVNRVHTPWTNFLPFSGVVQVN